MARLFIEARGLCDWRSRLAEPDKQWARHYSAFEAAVSWEAAASHASGLPACVRMLFDQQRPHLGAAELLLGVAEHRVPLKDGRRPSQNDVWALIRTTSGMVSLTVEAKAGEPFAEMVSVWLASAKRGSRKPERLKELRRICGLAEMGGTDFRYQLLHRTASALIEAKRFGAASAAMIVQSFRNEKRHGAAQGQLDDFHIFCEQFGVEASENCLVKVRGRSDIQLYLGWATCEPATDAQIAALT